MKKGKIFGIILVVLAAGLIGGGVFMSLQSEKPKDDVQEKEPRKNSTKAIVDGDNTNVEESFNKQRAHNEYRLKNFRIANQGDYYVFKVSIDNTGVDSATERTLKVTFLANNGDVLGNVEILVPEIAPGATVEIEEVSSNKDIFEAFDVKIEDVIKES